jgi:hypothetical protein
VVCLSFTADGYINWNATKKPREREKGFVETANKVIISLFV